MEITVKKLPSGYYHIRGDGLCEWTQPPHWPCDEQALRSHAFPEASDGFLRAVVRLAQQEERDSE